MLPVEPGQLLPMFTLTTMHGGRLPRASLRGKAALALIILPKQPTDLTALDALDQAAAQWTREECLIVVSPSQLMWHPQNLILAYDEQGTLHQQLVGAHPGGWIITDRYGMVYTQGIIADLASLPSGAQLHEWIEWVNMRCSG